VTNGGSYWFGGSFWRECPVGIYRAVPGQFSDNGPLRQYRAGTSTTLTLSRSQTTAPHPVR